MFQALISRLLGDFRSSTLEFPNVWCTFCLILKCVCTYIYICMGFLGCASDKEPACQYRRHKGSIPGSGRSPGGGCVNPLQYSCLENPMDRGAWLATSHRVAKSQIWLKQLSTHIYTHTHTHIYVCIYKDYKVIILFIYLAVLSLNCSMWGLVPWPGINPGPLHWERKVLAIGPPGKPSKVCF